LGIIYDDEKSTIQDRTSHYGSVSGAARSIITVEKSPNDDTTWTGVDIHGPGPLTGFEGNGGEY